MKTVDERFTTWGKHVAVRDQDGNEYIMRLYATAATEEQFEVHKFMPVGTRFVGLAKD